MYSFRALSFCSSLALTSSLQPQLSTPSPPSSSSSASSSILLFLVSATPSHHLNIPLPLPVLLLVPPPPRLPSSCFSSLQHHHTISISPSHSQLNHIYSPQSLHHSPRVPRSVAIVLLPAPATSLPHPHPHPLFSITCNPQLPRSLQINSPTSLPTTNPAKPQKLERSKKTKSPEATT